jgi:uncharacterized membrane protein
MKNDKIYSKSFRFLIIFFLVVGIVFRFTNLDRKIYWDDEVYTSLRVSGYTVEELVEQVYNGRVISIEKLQNYQGANSEKSVIDTVKSLAIEEPQNPPIYYVITRLWVQYFGNSVVVTRSLSALLSLIALFYLYWFCRELFQSSQTGEIATALMAVSPFHILYAQAARNYSLWTVTISLSSWALLRAMRLQTKVGWGIYALTVAVGLYTFPFSLFVSIGHGIYIAISERFRLSKVFISYLLASLVGFIAFIPWIFCIIFNSHKMGKWRKYGGGIGDLLQAWLIQIRRIFIDDSFTQNLLFFWLIGIIILILVGYSIYFLCHHTQQQVWLFVVTLIVTTWVSLALPDIILGGKRSAVTRYLIPCYIGIELAVAYLFSTKIAFNTIKGFQKRLWQLIAIAIFVGGVLSYANSSSAQVWWNNGPSKIGQIPVIIPIVNQSAQPLVISDNGWANVISLSYSLKPNVKFQLVRQQQLPEIPEDFSDYFLYKPSKDLREGLEKNGYQIQPAYQSGNVWLWRLSNK